MATRRQTSIKRQSNNARRYHSEYIYGNAVREPEILPRKRQEITPERKRKASSQVRRNRNRALFMNPAYVMFLAIAACLVVVVCVRYIQLQTNVRNQIETISQMQEELADLTEENDTAYNVVMDSVNLEKIRKTAMKKMGMVYASEGQVIEYKSPSSDTVKQYEEIPENGILTQSKAASKEN